MSIDSLFSEHKMQSLMRMKVTHPMMAAILTSGRVQVEFGALMLDDLLMTSTFHNFYPQQNSSLSRKKPIELRTLIYLQPPYKHAYHHLSQRGCNGHLI
jgi:hypothetical protein